MKAELKKRIEKAKEIGWTKLHFGTIAFGGDEFVDDEKVVGKPPGDPQGKEREIPQ